MLVRRSRIDESRDREIVHPSMPSHSTTLHLHVRLRREINGAKQQRRERRHLLLFVPGRVFRVVRGVIRGDFPGRHRQQAQQIQLGAVFVQDITQATDVPRAVRRVPPGVEALRQQRRSQSVEGEGQGERERENCTCPLGVHRPLITDIKLSRPISTTPLRCLVNVICRGRDAVQLIDAYLGPNCELLEYPRESESCMMTRCQLMISNCAGTTRPRYRFHRLCKPEENQKANWRRQVTRVQGDFRLGTFRLPS